MLLMHHGSARTVLGGMTVWPAEAARMMARLEAEAAQPQRRRLPRWEYRVAGDLILDGNAPSAPRWTVFTRDISPWAAGFITNQVVPVYRRAMLRIPTPEDQVVHVRCQVRRCREFAPGWYQAAVDFDREEIMFLV